MVTEKTINNIKADKEASASFIQSLIEMKGLIGTIRAKHLHGLTYRVEFLNPLKGIQQFTVADNFIEKYK